MQIVCSLNYTTYFAVAILEIFYEDDKICKCVTRFLGKEFFVKELNTKSRVLYFDVLNILAALSVVFLHCNGNSFYFTSDLAWLQAMMVEVICYWAVPVFVMLSGANLINYREKYTTLEFFKKRIMKTVIPFIIWTFIVAVLKEINPLESGWRTFVSDIVNCKIEPVYWFFIPLFAVYLSIPVIACLKENRKILWYMAVAALVINSLLPSLFSYLDLTWNYSLSMQTVGGLLIFTILGYLFSVTEFTKKQSVIIYFLAISAVLLKFVGTVIFSYEKGALDKTFYGYTSYIAVLQACGVFLFFKRSKIIKRIGEKKKISTIISKISSCSFGVYLMHMILYRFFARYIAEFHWEWRLIVPFVIYTGCLLVTYLLKKIPVVKYIVP